MTPPTDAELAEWGRLEREATPGEWEASNGGVVVHDRQGFPLAIAVVGAAVTPSLARVGAQPAVDATFIAAARSALPRLLAEVRRLRQEPAYESDEARDARLAE